LIEGQQPVQTVRFTRRMIPSKHLTIFLLVSFRTFRGF
jgi:hypothetical protein